MCECQNSGVQGKNSKLRALTIDEVRFSIRIERETESVRGNASAIDPVTDREIESEIFLRLERGEEWAWCTVFVTAQWGGYEAFESLGCCSYADEEDFKRGGYYDDMCGEALDALNGQIADTYRQIESLIGG